MTRERPTVADKRRPAELSIAARGWLRSHKWLFLRRAAQLFFLVLFLTGPLIGLWITKGTLASSLTLEVLPLTDPLMALQALVAGQVLVSTAVIGALIVLGAYLLVGGRAYCSWVCPVNVVTDAAHWLRVKMGMDDGAGLKLWPYGRHALLAAVIAVSAVTGTVAWEFVNPVTILHRGLVFGTLFTTGAAWALLLALFVFDWAVSRRGWCGHLCPVGAFYGLVGSRSLVRVSAHGRDACDTCMACFEVCPEPHVITPALRDKPAGYGPVVRSGDCTNCGRCIDVCHASVFRMTHRFDRRVTPGPAADETRQEVA